MPLAEAQSARRDGLLNKLTTTTQRTLRIVIFRGVRCVVVVQFLTLFLDEIRPPRRVGLVVVEQEVTERTEGDGH